MPTANQAGYLERFDRLPDWRATRAEPAKTEAETFELVP